MAIIKCKMCGGDLNLVEGSTVAECEYCGTTQTVPSADNEKKLTLFGRAGRLLRGCEFDKAAGVFETIVADFPEEAEAYWGLVLCKYGIEYVDDPATGKKIPTCHRSSFDSIFDDENFEQAQENADAVARRVYREEAKVIEDIRKGIIEVSGKEEPYDIFICYKETAEDGDRTLDSVLAQDIYDALTEKGYRVFFSRVTLEDKLGQEYEPYIFAALNSAKIMLAVGTTYDYYNAVWVKNEWSRFLKLIASGEKKTLIPCFKNLDPYDMPKEFAKLQSQDLGKVGAMQDLMRGIEKILPLKQSEPASAPQTVVVQGGNANLTALLKRGFMACEDGAWDKARDFFDQALNYDAECAEAYVGLMMVDEKIRSRKDLIRYSRIPLFERNQNFLRAMQFSAELRALVEGLKARRATYLSDVDYLDRIQARRKLISPVQGMIAAGYSCTLGLKTDGTAVAIGPNRVGECSVDNWTDIVAIAPGIVSVGLKSDGTVVATNYTGDKRFDHGESRVSHWTDIVAIAAGSNHTVGVKANGTVVVTGNTDSGRCNVGRWTDIVAVAAGDSHTVGLKADGTVVAVGYNTDGRCDVSGWTDILAVDAGSRHTVGLKADGTVVATGFNNDGQCEVTDWTDIVAVSAGASHTVGLKADGTVVATRCSNLYYAGQCDVEEWSEIVAISAGFKHTVGLKADGTVVATKYLRDGYDGQCEVSDWKLFESLDTVEQERSEAKARREREEAERKARREREEAERKARAEEERQAKCATLNKEKSGLQAELANLKGLFTGKRRREIEARLAQIEAELKKR